MTTAVVISVTSKNSVDELKKTLWSLASQRLHAVIVISEQMADEFSSEVTKEYLPSTLEVTYMKANAEDIDANNYYEAIYDSALQDDIFTFLKCGDLMVGSYMIPVIEGMFEEEPELLTINGKLDTTNHLSLYINEIINMQGWFFKKDFLDYYTFLKIFTNDIAFALHLSYISKLQPQYTRTINTVMVCVNAPLQNIGEAFVSYFNEVLPKQPFFNPILGTQYIYELVCECYISYVQAVNVELPTNDVDRLIGDICSFYQYFATLELDNIEELLKIYNKKIKKLYMEEDKAFTSKIPDITLVGFLEVFQKRINKKEK